MTKNPKKRPARPNGKAVQVYENVIKVKIDEDDDTSFEQRSGDVSWAFGGSAFKKKDGVYKLVTNISLKPGRGLKHVTYDSDRAWIDPVNRSGVVGFCSHGFCAVTGVPHKSLVPNFWYVTYWIRLRRKTLFDVEGSIKLAERTLRGTNLEDLLVALMHYQDDENTFDETLRVAREREEKERSSC